MRPARPARASRSRRPSLWRSRRLPKPLRPPGWGLDPGQPAWECPRSFRRSAERSFLPIVNEPSLVTEAGGHLPSANWGRTAWKRFGEGPLRPWWRSPVFGSTKKASGRRPREVEPRDLWGAWEGLRSFFLLYGGQLPSTLLDQRDHIVFAVISMPEGEAVDAFFDPQRRDRTGHGVDKSRCGNGFR